MDLKIKMKKRPKILLGTTIITAIAPFSVIACGGNEFLVGRGSNSISPIVSLINKQTLFNLIYSPDGSTFGARAMAQAKIDMDLGMASSRKEPGTLKGVPGIDYSNEQAGLQQEITNWNNNQVRTLTFAIDAIGIGLNLPITIKNALENNAPIVDFDNLAKIYALNQEDSRFPTWKQLLVNPQIKSMDNKDINSKPIPLAIEGGVSTSGKSEAFIDKIESSQWFQDNKEGFNIQNIRTHDPSIIPIKQQIADREQDAYNKNNNVIGSVMYYSLGYIIKNNLVNKVTLANISQNYQPWGLPTIANAQKGEYPWIRPFNIIYQTTNEVVAIKYNSLVQIILSKEFQTIIADKGFVPLSILQIELQSKTFKITDTDKKLNYEDPQHFDYGLKL